VLTTSLPHIRSGELLALAMAGRTRFEALPDVPALHEFVPGYEASAWAGVGVPRGTAPEIIERLNQEINAGLAEPHVRAKLAEIGTIPMTLSSLEFGAFVAAEVEKWARVVKHAGIGPG
jgi:tripartite-type tricarboxylate transporter receptor subunit TctC